MPEGPHKQLYRVGIGIIIRVLSVCKKCMRENAIAANVCAIDTDYSRVSILP